MLLLVEKAITGEICHSIYQYAKDNSKYMKDYFLNLMKVLKQTIRKKVIKDCDKLHNDLPFLPERIKTEKVKKLEVELHDKTGYLYNNEFKASIK